jgi:hypothetical protein
VLLLLLCFCRYVAFKHQRLLYLDLLGGIYQIAMACALLKHLQHPFTLVVLVMNIVKALPHLPLLLGGNNYREQHIRCATHAKPTLLERTGAAVPVTCLPAVAETLHVVSA